MKFSVGWLRGCFICLSFLAGLSGMAFASSHDRTQFGHDITIASEEHVREATCFGCTVRVRGQVDGDVTAFCGSVIVEDGASIGGDTTTFGGSVRLEKASKVNGDLTVFGGRIQRDPASQVGGDVTNFGGRFWLPLFLGLPFMMLGGLIALIVFVVRRLTRPSVPVAA